MAAQDQIVFWALMATQDQIVLLHGVFWALMAAQDQLVLLHGVLRF